MTPLELFETNWNRPLMALGMILLTIVVCVILVNMHKWLK